MEVLLYLIILILCEAALAGISIQTVSSIRSTPLTFNEAGSTSETSAEATSLEATTVTSTLSPEDAERFEERLQRYVFCQADQGPVVRN